MYLIYKNSENEIGRFYTKFFSDICFHNGEQGELTQSKPNTIEPTPQGHEIPAVTQTCRSCTHTCRPIFPSKATHWNKLNKLHLVDLIPWLV